MTTEQEWLGNIPTSPEFSLSAALEDAEGAAMVEEIIERKRLHNIRERFFQQLAWGGVHTDGHGNAIPRELPEHWQSLREAAVNGGGVSYTRSLNRPDVLRIGGHRAGKVSAQIEGSRAVLYWLDEHVGFLAEEWRDPHQEVRDLVVRTPWAEPSTVPEIGSVRWACKAPTAPVYAAGSNGWLVEQVELMQYPPTREYNRKLSEKEVELVSRFARGLGIGAHDTDG